MEREVENPMTIDSLWDRLDEQEREMQEEIELQRADMEYGSRFDW